MDGSAWGSPNDDARCAVTSRDLLRDTRVRCHSFPELSSSMPRIVKRSDPQAVKSGPLPRGVPLPRFVSPQLSQLVEAPRRDFNGYT